MIAFVFSKSRFATIVPIVNMSRAIRFYTEALGGKLLVRGEGDMKDGWASVRVGKEEFWLVKPQSRERRKLSYSVFLVDEIAAAVKELQGRGVKFEKAEGTGKDSKVKGSIAYEAYGASAFFKDSEGNLMMMWQTGPAS